MTVVIYIENRGMSRSYHRVTNKRFFPLIFKSITLRQLLNFSLHLFRCAIFGKIWFKYFFPLIAISNDRILRGITDKHFILAIPINVNDLYIGDSHFMGIIHILQFTRLGIDQCLQVLGDILFLLQICRGPRVVRMRHKDTDLGCQRWRNPHQPPDNSQNTNHATKQYRF